MVPHRRNVATADELARIEQFNSTYQNGIVPMRAGFTKNEKKGSFRPFSIFLSKDYPSGTSYVPTIMRNRTICVPNKRWNPVPVRHFSSMADIEKYADRKIKKEQYILDEIQKMQTLIKMYDLSNRIFIYRIENKESVFSIRVVPSLWRVFDDQFIRCDTVEKMVWRCHDLIRVHYV